MESVTTWDLSFINFKSAFAQSHDKPQTKIITTTKKVTRQNNVSQKELHSTSLNEVVITGNSSNKHEALMGIIAVNNAPTLLPSGDIVLNPVLMYQYSSNLTNKDPQLQLNKVTNPNINRPDEANYIRCYDNMTHSHRIKTWFHRTFMRKRHKEY